MIRIKDEDRPFFVISEEELAAVSTAVRSGLLLTPMEIRRQPRSGILVRFISRDQAALARHLAGGPKSSVSNSMLPAMARGLRPSSARRMAGSQGAAI